MKELDTNFEKRFDEVEHRFDRVEHRLDVVDACFDGVDGRVGRVDDLFGHLFHTVDSVEDNVTSWDPRFDFLETGVGHARGGGEIPCVREHAV